LPLKNKTPRPEPLPAGRRALAFAVHIFTASGVIWGFLALLEAVNGNVKGMFLWLAVALFVDGIDGTIARRVDIEIAAPRFSGAALDLVVDYLTYVVVPAYALVASDLLPAGWDVAAALIILLTSAMYFADTEMKTEDAWFQGFPADDDLRDGRRARHPDVRPFRVRSPFSRQQAPRGDPDAPRALVGAGPLRHMARHGARGVGQVGPVGDCRLLPRPGLFPNRATATTELTGTT
jgi:hypothetical protein